MSSASSTTKSYGFRLSKHVITRSQRRRGDPFTKGLLLKLWVLSPSEKCYQHFLQSITRSRRRRGDPFTRGLLWQEKAGHLTDLQAIVFMTLMAGTQHREKINNAIKVLGVKFPSDEHLNGFINQNLNPKLKTVFKLDSRLKFENTLKAIIKSQSPK